ncbi:MAG: RNA polymerase sigma factor [Candidatus Acidiferrales bacterium]
MAVPRQAILTGAFPFADEADETLAAIVREHAGFVFRIAYSVLRHHHDAEDAAQETFLRVYRQRRRLAEIRDVRAWLARIAWRVALDRRPRQPEVSLEDAAGAVRQLRAAGRAPEDVAADNQMATLLAQLIATLPRQFREALTLSTLEELSSAEAALILDIPEATVRTRVFRARELLREKFQRLLGGRHER